jgi:hypothetical protein
MKKLQQKEPIQPKVYRFCLGVLCDL